MSIWRTDVELEWTKASGSPGTNSWFFQLQGTENEPNEVLETAMDKLRTCYASTGMKQIYTNDTTIRGTGVWSRVDNNSGQFFASPSWQVTGTGGSSCAPPALALMCTRGSPEGGRRHIGRVYLGPLSQALIGTDGQVDGQWINPVRTSLRALLDDWPAAQGFTVYTKAGNTSRKITDFQVSAKFAVLRSRRD